MQTYHLKFVLHSYHATLQQIKNALAEFAEQIDILESDADPGMRGKHFRIAVLVDEPTLIFDTCAHFGRIKSVKITDDKKQ